MDQARIPNRPPSILAAGLSRPQRCSILLDDLDEIAASVVEYRDGNRAHGSRRPGETDTGCAEPGIFRVHIFDPEEGVGYSVLFDRRFEWPRSRVGVGFEQQLNPIGIAG